jgi:hypothetical protein
MATLISPGVSVTVIDESFYTPAASGTTPLVIVVSAEDKTNPSGSTAAGTLAANAGKIYLVTSQRDLTDTFGTPLFYTDSSGNPQHGNELNEYGLQAAYSSLGVSSRAYVVRADIDLNQLLPDSSVPKGEPVAGTYWVDTANSQFGVKEWSSVTRKFTTKTPLVLDDNTGSTFLTGLVPAPGFGTPGDYAMVVTNDNQNALYYRNSSNSWVQVTNDSTTRLQISPHYDYPIYDASTATGSVWITSTPITNGANWAIKYYNGTTKTWDQVDAPLYSTRESATYNEDAAGGGLNIPAGSLYIDWNIRNSQVPLLANFEIRRRTNKGPTLCVADAATSYATSGTTYSFSIAETTAGTEAFGSSFPIGMTATNTTTYLGQLFANAVLAQSNLQNVEVLFNNSTQILTISHRQGGEIKITGMTTATRTLLNLTPYSVVNQDGNSNFFTEDTSTNIISAWKPLVYEASRTAPYTDPADGTFWYNNVIDEVDILVNSGTTWVSYLNFFPLSDPGGPLIQATEPVNGDRSDGGNLVTGDIWIDTSDLELYGSNIYVYDSTITSGSKWVLQDTTDQTSPDGWVFADARWGLLGADTEAASITSLLSSNYVDPDAPDPRLYPRGIKLWNTRRSGFNVKKFVKGYIDLTDTNDRYFGESMTGYNPDRWVSQYPIDDTGAGVFGRKSQRQVVVKEMKSMVDTSLALRDTDSVNFNLIVAPGYPELISNMVGLNVDRGLTSFVIGDTPFRLLPNATSISNYGLNSNLATDNGEKGAVTYNEYMALYYPSGRTTDNSGNAIVVPPSHMMLRTYINNDAKSYLWFAPAGTRRAVIDNATSIGYIDSENEFRSTVVPQSIRDVMLDPNTNVAINPITNLTGVGIVAYGQRTRASNASALDRVNVARLVAYLRRQLDILSRPFLFEPNDAQTRREIKASVESLMLELVGQRALYDFIVVCDETNNTPARIDRNELYVDIAIEPVKAVEFIYIPLRIKNRGDIAAGL